MGSIAGRRRYTADIGISPAIGNIHEVKPMAKQQKEVNVAGVQSLAAKFAEKIEYTPTKAKNGLKSFKSAFSMVSGNYLPTQDDKPAVYYAGFTISTNGGIKTMTIRDVATLEAVKYLRANLRTMDAFIQMGEAAVYLNPEQKQAQVIEPDEDTPLI